jgi:hypothetical protein
MAVIGRCKDALSHCEHLIAEVKDVLARSDPAATSHLTPPFLATLESFEIRLRNSLGKPARKHDRQILSRLRPSLASVLNRVTSVTSLANRDEMLSDIKQGNRPAFHPVVGGQTNLESSPELSQSFTPQLSESSHPHLPQAYIPHVAPVNALPVGSTGNAVSDQGSGMNITPWSTTAVMARVIDTLAADERVSSPVHPSAQASGQHGPLASTDGDFMVPSFTYDRSQGLLSEQVGNSSLFQGSVHQSSRAAAESSEKTVTGQQQSSALAELAGAEQASVDQGVRISGQHGAKPDKSDSDKRRPVSSRRRWAIFGRLPRIISEKVTPVFGGRPQAHLGQKNSLVYNKELGRWVEEGKEVVEEDLAPPPPPDDDIVESTGHFDGHVSGSGREPNAETDSVWSAPPSYYQHHVGSSNIHMEVSTTPTFYAGPDVAPHTDDPRALSRPSGLQTTASAGAPPATMSPMFAGSVSIGSQDSGVPPFNSVIPLPDRTRAGSIESKAPPANANRFRAGRRVGRAAYVDTFNPKSTSTSSTPTASSLSAGPVLPARQAGALYRIFTPTAASADASADDNVSATSESTNALLSAGKDESFGRSGNEVGA